MGTSFKTKEVNEISGWHRREGSGNTAGPASAGMPDPKVRHPAASPLIHPKLKALRKASFPRTFISGCALAQVTRGL